MQSHQPLMAKTQPTYKKASLVYHFWSQLWQEGKKLVRETASLKNYHLQEGSNWLKRILLNRTVLCFTFSYKEWSSSFKDRHSIIVWREWNSREAVNPQNWHNSTIKGLTEESQEFAHDGSWARNLIFFLYHGQLSPMWTSEGMKDSRLACECIPAVFLWLQVYGYFVTNQKILPVWTMQNCFGSSYKNHLLRKTSTSIHL